MGIQRVLATTLALLALAVPALAQDRAALIADKIEIVDGNQLRAVGNVEILFQGSRLKAQSITYENSGGTIAIQGPLSLTDTDGKIIFLADAGELSKDFQNGVLTSARVVLDRQMQIAGSELRRVDGRYTQLFQAVASSCPVCETSDTPLWQIRASRIIHDQVKQRIFFQNAVFEVSGIPVFYVPRLRMPDTTVTRASGFLPPEIQSSSVLGSGIRVPYFQTLGDHADILATTHISPITRTINFRFRQHFKTGAIKVETAISNDEIVGDKTRGYLFGEGVFFLPRDYVLGFNVQLSADESYLFDYGISDQDRLRSDISLGRTREDSHFNAQLVMFRSFRDDEEFGSIPGTLGQVDFRRRFTPALIGGTSEYRLQAYGLNRSSTTDVVGRDYSRLSVGLGWDRSMVLGNGIKVSGQANADLDHFLIGQDSTAEGGTYLHTIAAVELSWPHVRNSPDGIIDVIEPRIQFASSHSKFAGVPNEESEMVEFDEGTLWSLDRIPGSTAVETGNQMNAGVTWSRQNPNGNSFTLTAGKILRTEEAVQFNEATGLAGTSSNWLIAGQLEMGKDVKLAGRALIANDLSITRNDLKLRWAPGEYELDANFLWHEAEPEVGRDLDTWELHTDAKFPINDKWVGLLDMRYDFATKRAASVGLNVTYVTRCIDVNFGLQRSFTSSDSVEPKTDFTISLSVPPVAVASKRPTLTCSR